MNQNNQQPYYNYTQHTPGPPQPQWQAPPRKGWGDPRISATSPTAISPVAPFPPPQGYGHAPIPQSFPPPPPPPPGGFPVPQYQDTSSWGVKYNQGQQFGQQQDTEPKPTLPPRPNSGQNVPPPHAWPGQSSQQKPPTPPPRPAEYANPQLPAQSHYFPHEQYSNRPTSHYYEPGNQWSANQNQNQNTSAPAWQNTTPKIDEPVSPIDHHSGWQSSTTVPGSNTLGASALGSGGPSDWEHFSGRFDESPPVQQQQQQHRPPPPKSPPPPQQSNQPPPDPPQQQHGRQQPAVYTATPEQVHAQPAYHSPGKPLPARNVPPPQQHPSATQNSFQQTPSRHSVALPYSDPASTHRPRFGSDATVSTLTAPERAGTIDSVIDAWSTSTAGAKVDPLRRGSRPISTIPEKVLPLREVASIQTQTDFPPIVKTETQIVTKVETREIDPYEDLKDEYRTSLNRYAAMLRQEKAANSEQEKMRIVSEFVNKEVKLRSVMFNAEPAELIRSSELAELRHEVERLKKEATLVIPPVAAPASQTGASTRSAGEKRPSIQTDVAQSQHSRDDSFVMVDANGDDADYSPGGRPRVTAVNRIPAQQRPITPAIPAGPGRNDTPAQLRIPQPTSPGANAPMTLDDYAMPDFPPAGPDRGVNATPAQAQRPGSAAPPPAPKSTNSATPIQFQPARPAYTPFRYSEAQLVSETNPANMAYTKLRHEQAAESGRILSQEPPLLTVTAPDRTQSATPSRARQQQEEAFIGLLRQQSMAVKKPTRTGTPGAPAPLRAGTPVMQRRPSLPPLVKSTESLRNSLPDNLEQLSFTKTVHPKLVPISQAIANIADDFSFIHATVVAWDKENRKVRHKLDAERANRESESQAHIDDLFHDNQIGYADIAGLEEEFKMEEAAKKYQEDQDELDSFSINVYEKVTGRLESEVAELERLRVRTLDILDMETESASHRIQSALRSPSGTLARVPLADAMVKMLQIFNKIEVRQQKIAEADFERERRRKRLELTVLYTNGDKVGVQKLEKDFEKAQAMQVLSEARKRDERANKLMDSFDRAAVRGLAENQEWLDEMSTKATVVRDLVFGAASNDPQGREREEILYGPRGVKESMELLQEAVNMVLSDSQNIVNMSSQADRLLNEADFAMFLAEAKIANADEKEFDKLKGEKAKEDQKLKDEADGRMNGVQKIPNEILGFIREVRDHIGNDEGHQQRINQALEAAKKRNQSPTG